MLSYFFKLVKSFCSYAGLYFLATAEVDRLIVLFTFKGETLGSLVVILEAMLGSVLPRSDLLEFATISSRFMIKAARESTMEASSKQLLRLLRERGFKIIRLLNAFILFCYCKHMFSSGKSYC